MALVVTCAVTSPIRSSAYPVTLPPGYSAVGNHNNLGGLNLISSFMSPGGPIDGMVVLKLNQDRQDWDYWTYDTGDWYDLNFVVVTEPRLNPGEGCFLFNPGTAITVNVPGPAAGGVVPTPRTEHLVFCQCQDGCGHHALRGHLRRGSPGWLQRSHG